MPRLANDAHVSFHAGPGSPGVRDTREAECDENEFERDTRAAASSVRDALAQLVASIPAPISRPYDLQRTLKIDSKVCWQVFNVIRGGDPLSGARHIPGAPSLRRLLKATARLKVPAPVIESVNSAIDRFNGIVESHAGDRVVFDSMVSAASPGGADAGVELVYRRNAYRANCHLYGMHVNTFSRLALVRRAAGVEGVDECFANMKVGLLRLRPGASTRVHVYAKQPLPDPNSPSTATYYSPLDSAAAERYGVPLMPEFCSQPLPTLQTIDVGDGWVRSELAGRDVGLRSAVRLAFSSVGRGIPLAQGVDGRRVWLSSTLITVPTALLIKDIAVHRPSFGIVEPEAVVYSSSSGDETLEQAARADAFPAMAEIERLGTGSELTGSKEIPDYRGFVQAVCHGLSWGVAEFDFYRVRIAYPVLNSVVRLQFYV
jgi:hypothetical protein